MESSGHFSSILWILNFGLEYRIPCLKKKKHHASPKKCKKAVPDKIIGTTQALHRKLADVAYFGWKLFDIRNFWWKLFDIRTFFRIIEEFSHTDAA